MRKTKCDALWNELTPEQLNTLDKWLFEKNLGYAEALSRAKSELGFRGTMSSLKRFFARRKQERAPDNFVRNVLANPNEAATDAKSMRCAAINLAGKFAIEKLQKAPEEIKQWAPVVNLMVQNDYNDVLRESKAAECQIRREAMGFAKEKFEFDTMEVALKALPQLRELADVKRDPNTKRYEENAHWNRVRRAMFGFLDVVHPESAKEEAELLAAKRERESKREQGSEEETITDALPPTPSSPHYEEYVRWKAARDAGKWEMCAEYEI